MGQKLVPLTTEQGKKRLGQLLRASRDGKGWSLDDLIKQVEVGTGQAIGKSTISSLERGNSTPNWDTLALLAAVEYVLFPATNTPLSAHDMFDVACEVVNPFGG